MLTRFLLVCLNIPKISKGKHTFPMKSEITYLNNKLYGEKLGFVV